MSLLLLSRFYRLALRAFPESFRVRFAAEMLADFRDGCRDAHSAGLRALLVYLVFACSDLLISLFSEWRPTLMRNTLPYLFVLAAALVLGWIDTHYKGDDMGVFVLLVLIPTFLFGVSRPRDAWQGGLIVGLAIPFAHLLCLLCAWKDPSPPEPNVFAAFLAVIPAMIGAYIGAGFRLLVAPPAIP